MEGRSNPVCFKRGARYTVRLGVGVLFGGCPPPRYSATAALSLLLERDLVGISPSVS